MGTPGDGKSYSERATQKKWRPDCLTSSSQSELTMRGKVMSTIAHSVITGEYVGVFVVVFTLCLHSRKKKIVIY